MKKKKATITVTDKEGNVIIEVPLTQANDDWLRAGRLAEKAKAGDKEAAEELKRMQDLNHQYFEEEARPGLHKEETVSKFYEQKGTPIPEEASKWFTKGKAYKNPRKRSKASEPEGGYGGLFDQLNE